MGECGACILCAMLACRYVCVYGVYVKVYNVCMNGGVWSVHPVRNACMQVCVCVMCVYLCVYYMRKACMHVYMCVCVYVHVCVYIYTHT